MSYLHLSIFAGLFSERNPHMQGVIGRNRPVILYLQAAQIKKSQLLQSISSEVGFGAVVV